MPSNPHEIGQRILAARAELAEAEAEAVKLHDREAAKLCAALGHEWKFMGGCNAGCDEDCACSVPVHECTRCHDCDYGENAEAESIRAGCALDRGLEL